MTNFVGQLYLYCYSLDAHAAASVPLHIHCVKPHTTHGHVPMLHEWSVSNCPHLRHGTGQRSQRSCSDMRSPHFSQIRNRPSPSGNVGFSLCSVIPTIYRSASSTVSCSFSSSSSTRLM